MNKIGIGSLDGNTSISSENPAVFCREICDTKGLIDTFEGVQRSNGEWLLFVGIRVVLHVYDMKGEQVHEINKSKDNTGYLQEIKWFPEFQSVVFVVKGDIWKMDMTTVNEFETPPDRLSEIQSRGDYYNLTDNFFNYFLFTNIQSANASTNASGCYCLHRLDVTTNKVCEYRSINSTRFDIVCMHASESLGLVFLGGRKGIMILNRDFEEVIMHGGVGVCSISLDPRRQVLVFGSEEGKLRILPDYRSKTELSTTKYVQALSSCELHSCLTSDKLVICCSYLDPVVVVFTLDQFRDVENTGEKDEHKVDEPICIFKKHRQYVNGLRWLNPNKRRFFVSCGYNGKIVLYENLRYQNDDLFKDLKERIEYLKDGLEEVQGEEGLLGISRISVNILGSNNVTFYKFMCYQ